ncbi:hypothetical protein [Aureimonas sp. AU12]|uniref:hypothetical protein n=1 Tax=Aureimonas sp. AU12 TaxID=1638161 RepID=UPI00078182AC|nr:hypothetical protein [Aureimonas sp. AU12]
MRVNAVLPNWTVPIIPLGGRAGATNLLYLGFPRTPNAFRKARRPSSLESKAVTVPYTGATSWGHR